MHRNELFEGKVEVQNPTEMIRSGHVEQFDGVVGMLKETRLPTEGHCEQGL
jgi:hypothetical protein